VHHKTDNYLTSSEQYFSYLRTKASSTIHVHFYINTI